MNPGPRAGRRSATMAGSKKNIDAGMSTKLVSGRVETQYTLGAEYFVALQRFDAANAPVSWPNLLVYGLRTAFLVAVAWSYCLIWCGGVASLVLCFLLSAVLLPPVYLVPAYWYGKLLAEHAARKAGQKGLQAGRLKVAITPEALEVSTDLVASVV